MYVKRRVSNGELALSKYSNLSMWVIKVKKGRFIWVGEIGSSRAYQEKISILRYYLLNEIVLVANYKNI